MTEIIHDGMRLVPSRESARRFNITNDYIGRLCKQGKVSGSLISGSWYVNEDSLRDFLLKTNREKYERREALREQRAHAYREAQARLLGDTVPTKRAVIAEKKTAPLPPRPLRIHATPRRVPKTFTMFAQRGLAVMFAVVIIVGGLRFSDASVFQVAREVLPAAAAVSGRNDVLARGSQSAIAKFFGANRDDESYWIWYETNGATYDQPEISSGLAEKPSVIERIVDAVTPSSISEALLNARLAAMESRLMALISLVPPTNSVAPVYHYYIDNTSGVGGSGFDDIDITNSTYTGGTITGATITGGSVTATDFDGVLPVANGGTGTSTYAVGDILYADSPSTLGRLSQGTNGQVLKVVGGNLVWSQDIAGGGGSGAFATTSDDLAIYVADPSDVVIIGSNATSTTGNILEVAGNALFRGALTAYNAITAPIFTATSTTATSTMPRLNITGSLGIGSDYITDISGDGLSVQSGALSLDRTGDWTGTFDGLEGSYYLANSFSTTSASYFISQQNLSGFSTTSADYWKTQRDFFATTSVDYWKSVSNFFSTTSAEYFLSQNQEEAFSTTSAAYFISQQNLSGFSTTSADFWQTQRNFFSTTSTDYWKSVNNFFSTTSADFWKTVNNFFSTSSAQYFVNASTTIPKTYSANTFTALQTFGNASSSILSADTFCLSNDCRTSWPSAGSSFAYPFPNNATSTTITFNNGLVSVGSTTINGNATTTGMQSVGSLSINGERFTDLTGSGLLNTAGVLTLDTSGNWTGTFDGQEGSYYLANSFSTTSASYFSSIGLAWSTTSANYYLSQNGALGFSTTSNDYWMSQRNFFSTSSASYFLSQNQGAAFSTTSADAWKDQRNFFSTTSAAYFSSVGLAFSTTSNDYWASVRNFFSTTSASYFLSQNQGAAFSSTSANYFIHSSTTVPKLYTSNTWTGGNVFSNATTSYATTTNLFVTDTFAGAGLGACNAAGDKLIYNANTKKFECGSDAGAGGGITSLRAQYSGSQTGSAQVFATSSDTNLQMTITSSGDTHTFTPVWNGVLAVGRGGTGIASTPNYGQVLVGDGLGGYMLAATSSLGLSSSSFSTTSADYWQTQRNFFSTTSTDYWKTQNSFFSTTSSDYWATQRNFFSTTSASYFLSQNQGNAFSTTSANYWKSVNDFFSTTSAMYFTHSSTTIAKTYTSNTFTALQNFANASSTLFSASYASTTNLFANTASTSNLTISALQNGLLKVGSNGVVSLAVAGTDYQNFAYPFPNNATSTTITFNNGLVSVGSTTINGNATTTGMQSVGSLYLNSERFTDLTGTGLTNSGGVLTLDTSGNWTGTFDGQEGSYYLANGFSTTSADYWKTQRDFFSTTSASYFSSIGLAWSTTSANYYLSQNGALGFSTTSNDYWMSQRNFFSTTSANYWQTTRDFFSTTSANYFVSSSTTIPKTYTNNTFTGTNVFNAITLGALNGPLQANNGVISATSSILAIYGGTGQTTYSVGDILYADSAGTLTRLPAGGTGTVLKIAGGVPVWGTDITSGGGGGATAFSTTSDSLAIYPTDSTDVFILGSNATVTANSILEVFGRSYFSQNVGIGTTSPGSMLAVSGNILANRITGANFVATSTTASVFPYASTTALSATTLCLSTDCRTSWPTDSEFSTTSADYWASQRNFFSTSSADYYKSVNNFFSTTSADYWQTTKNFFSTTSAAYFLSQNQGAAFSTTSANYFAASSTTIPKTYTANTFTALQTFGNASSTLFSTVYASSTFANIGTLNLGSALTVSNGGTGSTTLTGMLKGNGTGAIQTAIPGVDYLNSTSGDWTGTFDGQEGSYYLANSFSTTSANYWSSLGLGFSTTSSDYWMTQRNFFSTTSANYWKSVNDFFSTTSAMYFTHSSTTIAKTYTANTFTALQQFANASSTLFSSSYASTTNLFANTASTSNLTISALQNGLLKVNASGVVSLAVAGTDYANFAYPFPAGATSSLVAFNGGLTAYASTTIGNGTQTGGLTISGGATTTGNAYFGGNVSTAMIRDGSNLSAVDVANRRLLSTGTVNALDFSSASAIKLSQYTTNGFLTASGGNGTLAVDTTLSTSGGNLGVGTSSPYAKLSVAGEVVGANFTATTTAVNALPTLLSTNASTTNLGITGLPSALLATDANGRVYATTSISSNLLNTTGNWTGTFDGQEGSYYLANSFSTTSADYWKTQRDFFSTTSASYFLSQNQGNAFSTTSANYFVSSSTTIPKTYTSNTFTGSNIFNGAFTLGSLNGPLQANNGLVSATTSIGVLYGGTGLTSAPSYGQLLMGNASNGYTLTATSSLGLQSVLQGTQGQISYFSGTNSAVGTSTIFITSAGRVGVGTTTPGARLHFTAAGTVEPAAIFEGGSDASLRLIGGASGNPEEVYMEFVDRNDPTNSFTIGTDDNAGRMFFGYGALGTINNHFQMALSSSGNLGIGSTSPSSRLSVSGDTYLGGSLTATGTVTFTGLGSGLVKSTGGVLSVATPGTDYVADTTGNWTGTFDGQEGSYYLANSFSTTSANYWSSLGLGFSTTSSDYWMTQRNFFSTTSANYWKSVNDFFSTTSAMYFTHSSTTIAKTYTANTFTALQNFANASSTLFSASYASTTNLFANTASTSNLTISALQNGLLKVGSNGVVSLAVAGTDYQNFAYPFPNNATSTTLRFNGGLYATASSTFSDIVNLPGGIWNSNGNVGIGMTNPSHNLDVTGNARFTTGVRVGTGGSYEAPLHVNMQDVPGVPQSDSLLVLEHNGQNVALNLFTNSDYDTAIYFGDNANNDGGRIIYDNSTSALLLGANDSTNQLILASNERVGIGTASPSSKLTVVGEVTAANFTATTTAVNTFPTLLSTNASTTNLGITGLPSALLATDANGRVYATTSISSGLLNTSGNWTGTFDGQEGSYYLANAFSTTSANYWQTTRDFFSTTSANYWKSVNDFFSTTSAIYFAHSSTTIPKTYTANAFTALQTFANASSTLFSSNYASTTDLRAGAFTLGALNGPLQANNGLVSATTSIGVLYGGTGLTSAPTFGQLLVGNASGGYTLTATSSLGLPTFAYPFPSNSTSTTLTFTNGLVSVGSTTINGNATTTGMQSVGSLFINSERFTDLTGTGLQNVGGALTLNATGDWTGTFDGQEGSYYLANSFSTTSAIYFTHSSTTIPKTYTANSFTALQSFLNASSTLFSSSYASTTNLFASNASTSALTISGTPNTLLKTNASGQVVAAVAGTDYQTFAYPFSLTGNATSSLTQFNGGLTAYASSTIGAGAQATGLTISGGATTTGFLKVLGTATSSFAGPLAITSSGTSTFTNGIQISAGCFRDAFGNCIGNQDLSAYVDGAGNGATNRVAYWTDNNTLTSSANFSFDGTTVTARDLLIQHTAPILSINDSGSTGTDFRIDVSAGSATFNADISNALSNEFFAWNTNNNEKMRLTEAGRLGIGATSPRGPLDVMKDGFDVLGTGAWMEVGRFVDAAETKGISLGYDNNNDVSVIASHTGTGGDNGLAFWTYSGGWSERMRLSATGSFGIGTTSPGSLLSIGDTQGINFSTATSTFSSTGGIDLRNGGCYAVNGTCIVSAGAAPFSFANNFGVLTAATSSRIWVQNGIFASSTSQFANANIWGQLNFATTTLKGPLAVFNGLPFITASTTAQSTSFGENALGAITSGSRNTAIGYQAMINATSTRFNTALGYNALACNGANCSGEQNTAIGDAVLASNRSGGANTGVGISALQANTTGGENSALGAGALTTNTTGRRNIAFGNNALVTSNSDGNIALGFQAGDALTSGSNNILLGYNIDLADNTWSNRLNIGNLVFGTGIDGEGTTLSSGNIGIGTTTPQYKFTSFSATAPQLSLSAGAGIGQWTFRNAGGNLYFSTTTVAGTATTTIAALEISGSGFGTTTVRGLNIAGVATSTSNVGFNLTAGCYAVNGTCITGGSGSSFAYLFPSNATSTTLTFNNGLLSTASSTFTASTYFPGGVWDSSGNVGINVASPSDALDVAGNINIRDGYLTFQNEGYGIFGLATPSTLFYNDSIRFVDSGTELVRIADSGKVGIGTTSPFARLSIHSKSNETNPVLFAVGSSTASATTTLFSISNTGSTTASNGFNITAGCYAVNGTCLGGSSGSAFPFTPTTNFGVLTNATATSLWLQTGFQASSTSRFADAALYGTLDFATTSASILARFNDTSFLTASSTGQNISLGTGSLSLITSGTNNTALGQNALSSATSSMYNTAVGANTLANVMSDTDSHFGSFNTAIGANALLGNTTGDHNSAVGVEALSSNTTGDANTAFGRNALSSNLSGSRNVAIGSYALRFNTLASDNIAIGDQAMGDNDAVGPFSGEQNTALGTRTLSFNSSGSRNVALGYGALWNNSTGANNISIGYRAGYTLTSGSNNIVIGHDIDVPSNASSNQLSIGNLLFGTGLNGTGTTLSSGNIGVGTTTPSLGRLTSFSATAPQLSLSAGTGVAQWAFRNAGGNLYFSTTTVQGIATTTLSAFTITGTNGNVGVGTSSPGTLFSIGNTNGVNFTTATTTFGGTGGIDLRNGGCYAINGTCISAGGAGDGVGNWFTGTTNFNAVASATTTPIWLQAGLQASSTAYFSDLSSIGIFSFATTSTNATSTLMKLGNDIFFTASSTAKNTGAGPRALDSVTGGSSNTALGYAAASALTTSTNSTAVGVEALFTATTGFQNTAVGSQALRTANGSNNVAVGYGALFNATGNDNVGIGAQAGYNVSSGNNNIILGSYSVSGGISSGSNNIVIGDSVTSGISPTGSNQLNIGNLLYGTGLGNGAALSASGRIAIGTSTPQYRLTSFDSTAPQLSLSAGAGLNQWAFRNAGGNLYFSTTTISGLATTTSPAFMLDGLTGRLGLGTSSPWASLSVLATGGSPQFVIGSTTTQFIVDAFGNVGVATTSPYARLSVAGAAAASYFNADSASATSTFAGGLDVGGGALKYDYSSGLTSIQNLALGALTFDTDGGILSWVDMPVTSSAAVGTVESYSAQIDGTSILTVYSESDGIGGIKATSTKIGIGTTTPFAKLAIQASDVQTAPLFEIASTSSATKFLSVSGTGFGTTTLSGLNISGSATSTSNVGFNITAGCYAINGTCITGGGGGGSGGGSWSTTTSPVSGQLVNYPNNATDVVAIGSNSTTTAEYWFDPNAGISYLSGNVGIGTLNPVSSLDLGPAANGRGIAWGGSSGNANYSNIFSSYSAAALVLATGLRASTTADVYESSYGSSISRAAIRLNPYGSNAAGSIQFFTDSASTVAVGTEITPTERVRITSNGSVGIGTSTPYSGDKLSIYGGNLFLANTASPQIVLKDGAQSNNNLGFRSVSGVGHIGRFNDNGTLSSFIQTFDLSTGNVGIGSTTPWAKLSIVGNHGVPQFIIATTSDPSGDGQHPLFIVQSTTTGKLNYQRIGMGTTSAWGSAGLRDQLVVDGRVYSTWRYASCDYAGAGMTANVTATTDVAHFCGPFMLDLDADGMAIPGSAYPGYVELRPGNTNPSAGDGATIRMTRVTVASSSPVLEAWVRTAPSATATNTPMYMVGFRNDNIGADTGAVPTNGIYFAATTTSTWRAITRFGGVETMTNTGIATSTNASTTQQRMRIEVTDTEVQFLINGNVVARHTTHIPTTYLAPYVGVGVLTTGTSGGTPNANARLQVSLVRLWVDDPPGGLFIPGAPPIEDIFDPIEGADIAEAYLADDPAKMIEGTIVSNATTTEKHIARSSGRYDSQIMGVIATSPKMVLGDEASTTVRVGMVGRVPVIVSLENGIIKKGDPITSSSLSGIGMKARRPGAIVGKTLSGFDPENNVGFCDAELKQQLSDMGLVVEDNDCFGRVLVVLDSDFDMGIGEVVQDALDNITSFATAMDELANTAFEKGAEFTKLVVGQFVAKIAIIEKLFVKETHTETLCIADASGAETCVTKAQLDALLANVGVAAAPQPEPEPAPQPDGNASSTPPTDGSASSTPPVAEGGSGSGGSSEASEETPPAEEPSTEVEPEPTPEPVPEPEPEPAPAPEEPAGETAAAPEDAS